MRLSDPLPLLLGLSLGFALPATAVTAAAPPSPQGADFLDMSLEDLIDTQVTSVSKRPQSLSDTASAVFVIDNDALRRSGATNIAEALRMVPGINVARISANKWAISSRGFAGRFSNKLLVLIDGRSVYSPSFSGVYWEAQDVLLEDVDRIEVIRGPGATVWGANAVNGVINIITRHAAETQGSLLSVGGGTEERAFAAARYGARLGEKTYGRFYLKRQDRDGTVFPNGADAADDWQTLRGGFRIDTQLSLSDSVRIQGDLYLGDVNQAQVMDRTTPPFRNTFIDESDMAGGNVLMRWNHADSPSSDWTLQAYYDWTERDEILGHERRHTLDLDFTQHIARGAGHDVMWGAGYRYTQDDFSDLYNSVFSPASRADQLFSAFVQDEIGMLDDRLRLTLGAKLEHNDYSGFELQPSARVAWRIRPDQHLWGAVSRAVRTPSRIDHDVTTTFYQGTIGPQPLPVFFVTSGDDGVGSEELIAYEIGYRVTVSPGLSLDVAAFYNDYDKLRVTRNGAPTLHTDHVEVPVTLANGASGNTFGIEVAAAWQVASGWRLDGAYSYTQTQVDWPQPFDEVQNTAAPKHELSLRSAMDLSADVTLDAWLRYTDTIEVFAAYLSDASIPIDAYWSLDLRLAWRPAAEIELSLTGRNLLDSHHMEYIQELFTLATEVQRGVYGKVEWRF